MSFECLFAPLVSTARERLRRQIDSALEGLLTSRAHSALEEYLLGRLCSAGRKVVDQQFHAFCTVRAVFSSEVKDQGSGEIHRHQEFIGDDPAQRLCKIFEDFPGLAEICEVLVENWLSAVREFLVRLNADIAELPIRFAERPLNGPIDELHAGLSDTHRAGRCVVRIRFPDSVSLIYKPRPLAPEAHFSVLLEELNTEITPHALRGARCWDRGEYGWMEDIAPKPCEQSADLQAFYWRAGALLALVYLLRGVDMHKENLIALGAHPVLIDLETLWHPQEHVGAGDDPVADTVLRTGFLPMTNPHAETNYKWGALSHRSESCHQAARHLPELAGAMYPGSDFLPDILAGFRWIGAQVFEEGLAATRFQIRVQAIAQCRRRRVFRSTAWYQSLIERMVAPPSLHTAASFAATCCNVDQSDPPLLEEERWSLLQMDIPWVEQVAKYEGEQNVTLPTQNIEAFLKQEAIIIDALAPAVNKDALR